MPHNWQRICCPGDFSACSRAALDQAVSLAFHTGAEIFLLHAMEPPVDTLVTASGTWPPGVLSQLEQDLTDELARWQQAALEAGADHVASEVTVSAHTLGAIVHHAAEHRCDGRGQPAREPVRLAIGLRYGFAMAWRAGRGWPSRACRGRSCRRSRR